MEESHKLVRSVEDPYETGDGSEAWHTKECIETGCIPASVPAYYQVASPVSRGSSRSGTPVESESPKPVGRRGVYVLPSPPLKRWLWEQGQVDGQNPDPQMTEEQFEDMFTIRRSDWIFQFSEYPVVSPSMRRIKAALAENHELTEDSQVVMIYMMSHPWRATDTRSPVVRLDGSVAAADGGGTVGVRSSLVRYIVSTLSFKGVKVSMNRDDMEAFCKSRVELSEECKRYVAEIGDRKVVSVWASFVLDPIDSNGKSKLRVLVHAVIPPGSSDVRRREDRPQNDDDTVLLGL